LVKIDDKLHLIGVHTGGDEVSNFGTYFFNYDSLNKIFGYDLDKFLEK
jgi:hypothetical protein